MITDRYREVARAAFMNPKTFASTLLAILADAFATLEFVNWDPETLQAEIKSDLGLSFRDIPTENQDKLMMMIGVYGTNLFQQSVEWFCHACNAFNGDTVIASVFDPPTLDEIAWACMEVSMQQVELEDDTDYHPEIKAYVGQQASREGYTKLPDILDWADAPDRSGDGALDPAALGSAMFAASVQADQEKLGKTNEMIKLKTHELGVELASFPFIHRPKEANGSR